MESGIKDNRLQRKRRGPTLVALAGAAVALGLAAAYVRHRTRQAERETPPVGQFVEIDGVRLHYAERGSGAPVVLLHGNGGLIEDMELSGLAGRLARNHRVIIFDRPGFGYSSRPRTRLWTPEAQAALLEKAYEALDIRRPVVVGHSWGTLVAIALGLERPQAVRSLVLLSGYHFPTARADAVLFALVVGSPVVGDLLRFTLGPLVARAVLPAFVRRLFWPNPVPDRFGRFPLWMALRPGQSRAIAAEFALLIPAAARLSRRFGELEMPVFILAGERDVHVNSARQSRRLHAVLPGSVLRVLPGAGHMIHYVATEEVARAVEEAAERASA